MQPRRQKEHDAADPHPRDAKMPPSYGRSTSFPYHGGFTMKITFHGHACVAIETQGTHLLIDPFFTGNDLATVKADEVAADYILLTHGHGDHYGDTEAIVKRTGATVVSSFEVTQYAQKNGCEKIHPMNPGGSWNFPFGRVKLTLAYHSSSMPDGSYGGNPAGLLLFLEGKVIYHAGDTALFSDMKLIGEEGIDLAFLPIGDNFTMGVKDAARAVDFLQPKLVVPIHYDTFGYIKQSPNEFGKLVSGIRPQTEVAILNPGQTITLE
jgi:L-ascorbate metabolism protein UlaG (beta-lactamase superfamily)